MRRDDPSATTGDSGRVRNQVEQDGPVAPATVAVQAPDAREVSERATLLAINLVSRRWNLNIVHCLRHGPLRFTDLMRQFAISPNVLSDRLRHLMAAGVVARRHLDFPPTTKVYELTEHGRALDPVLDALAAWGRRDAALPGGRAAGGEPTGPPTAPSDAGNPTGRCIRGARPEERQAVALSKQRSCGFSSGAQCPESGATTWQAPP